MAVVKCKMCGGDLQINGDEKYGTCAYCGTVVTLPSIADAQIENLFMRAEQFRHMKQFDKALETYTAIINIFPTDSEAHWGALLSRYGIEYVEDPISHERIPTCHRVQLEPITSDSDYVAAVNNAPDCYAKELYEFESKRILEIQKEILAISATEEPYDVFICYKESTVGGVRTQDSIKAQDIYDYLTDAGLKVFFARITLEGKLGSAYEPLIFAALNSSKVMLVIGTAPEFVNAVWVRNEWSRFLLIMSKDHSKVLIPCYYGMSPYDFPEELKVFQAQDMSKIGFMQNLLIGINTVIASNKNVVNIETEEVIDFEQINEWTFEAEEALKKEKFAEADLLIDQILKKDPQNVRALFVKLLISHRVSDGSMLTPEELQKNRFFSQIMRHADADLLEKINAIISNNRTYFYDDQEKIRRGPYSKAEINAMFLNGVLNAQSEVFNSRSAVRPISLSQFLVVAPTSQAKKKEGRHPYLQRRTIWILFLFIIAIVVLYQANKAISIILSETKILNSKKIELPKEKVQHTQFLSPKIDNDMVSKKKTDLSEFM